jgi:hypothetical protein
MGVSLHSIKRIRVAIAPCGYRLFATLRHLSLDLVEITNYNHSPRPYCTAAIADYMQFSSDRIGVP